MATLQLTLSLCLLLPLCLLSSAQRKDVQVSFEEDGFTFNIYIDSALWFRSGAVGMYHKGKWWSNENTDSYILKPVKEKTTMGSDSIGQYNGMEHTWMAYADSKTPTNTTIQTSVHAYEDVSVVSFDILYVSGLSPGNGTEVKVASSFPSFLYKEAEDLERGWMTWSGGMTSNIRFGKWSATEKVYGEVDGGFPLVVFDSEMKSAVVLSPLTSFMSALQTSYTSKKTGDTMLTFGPFSTITEVPAGYRYRTLLVAADRVTSAMKLYGEILMSYYGKDHSYRKSDYSINYLGYWTDNGACYYYYKGNYSNYEDLLVDVKKDADAKGLPYRYLQLDSWWYFKGDGDGVKNWTARPDVFPNGIESLQQKTDWPIVAHNRYWSHNNDYTTKYKFIVEDHGALPDDYGFWDYLISTGVEDWKLITYEQDWLNVQFNQMNVFKTDIMIGERWLRQMAEAAKNYDVHIQYCMPWPRHVLQSVMNPMVTQIRVSGDYNPDNEQWKVGDSTILSHFVGLAAFKDDFRSSSNQPDCTKYRNVTEEFPLLEAYAAAMTGGPVGPSDMIGMSNISIVMATCMKNGRILKPTHPTISLDSTFLRRTFGKEGPMGQMGVSYTQVGEASWYFVMAAELEADYALSFSELPPTPTNSFPGFSFDAVVFQYDIFTGKAFTIEEFTDQNTITVGKCGKSDFKYHVIAPRFFNGMYLFGELDKLVTVSEQRFVSFDQTQDAVYIRLAGVPTETVSVTVYDGQTMTTVPCPIRDDYYAELTMQNGSATCS